jgi:Transposase
VPKCVNCSQAEARQPEHTRLSFILSQAEEGVAVEDVCRNGSISPQTDDRWRKRYGRLNMKRLSCPRKTPPG